MIKRHLPNVLSYFRHRITNSASEALNSVIQMLKKRAFGYRSFRNFRTAILFRCGGLDLYPATHPIPDEPSVVPNSAASPSDFVEDVVRETFASTR